MAIVMEVGSLMEDTQVYISPCEVLMGSKCSKKLVVLPSGTVTMVISGSLTSVLFEYSHFTK